MFMKKFKVTLIAILMAVAFTSCMTLTHTVGNGAQTGVEVTAKQWYVLWGLVPLNDVDSKAMAAGASDYTIKSQTTFVDAIISSFTSIVTVNVQTVKVKR